MRQYNQTILLLQGGGAIGAYHAGVYEGLAEAGIVPNWVAGISIGAVNSALIAGNPPERRLERLREFWDLVSSHAPMQPLAIFEPFRPFLSQLGVGTVATLGIPGFFTPRFPPPQLHSAGSPEALSIYDTKPLKHTLERLVDFDLINERKVRLSLGSVNVMTGDSVYFDNENRQIGPDHVRASGALPPGFPPMLIDGQYYWDGGILTNSPLWYIQDCLASWPTESTLIIEVDLFPAAGPMPRSLDEASERVKDLQFASKARSNIDRMKLVGELRASIGRLLDKLPAELQKDPDVEKIKPFCQRRDITFVRFVNRNGSQAGQYKDADFSRATVKELWAAGLGEVRHIIKNAAWIAPLEPEPGVRIFDRAI
jgi:NTE family protein